jgi:outer membrane protein TolC
MIDFTCYASLEFASKRAFAVALVSALAVPSLQSAEQPTAPAAQVEQAPEKSSSETPAETAPTVSEKPGEELPDISTLPAVDENPPELLDLPALSPSDERGFTPRPIPSMPASENFKSEPLTLKAVIAMVLRNNGGIKSADMGKVIGDEAIKAALLAYDLTLEGGYLYQSIDSPQNTEDYVATGGSTLSPLNPALPTEPSVYEQRNHIARIGLTQKLQTGATLELGTTTRVLDNTLNRRLPPSLFNPEYETFTGLTVTQPLLRDWGKAANTAEIRIAKANAAIADLEWQSLTAQTVGEAMKRYYDVVFTLDNLKVQREAIGLAQKLMGDTQARGREGVVAGNDVLVAEAGVYERMEDALAAELQYIERQNALQLLFKSAEAVVAQVSRIQPVDSLRTSVPVMDRPALMRTALERRYEVQQSTESITVKAAQVDYATSQSRPRLDLVASGGLHGLDGDLGGSYGEAAGGQGPEWTAGVQFSMPLNLDHLQARRRSALDELTQANVQRGDVRLRVALELDTVISRLRMDQQRLVTTRKSREAAQQSAEGGLKRLNEGVTTSFEVLQLQKDFTDARSREYAALADMNKDIVDLYLATGTLLDEQGVTVLSDAARTRQEFGNVPVVPLAGPAKGGLDADEEKVVRAAPARAKTPSVGKFKRN